MCTPCKVSLRDLLVYSEGMNDHSENELLAAKDHLGPFSIAFFIAAVFIGG